MGFYNSSYEKYNSVRSFLNYFDDGRKEIMEYKFTKKQWENRSRNWAIFKETLIQQMKNGGFIPNTTAALKTAKDLGDGMTNSLRDNKILEFDNKRGNDFANLIQHAYATYVLALLEGSSFSRKFGEIREVYKSVDYDVPINFLDSQMDLVNNNLGIEIAIEQNNYKRSLHFMSGLKFLEKVLDKIDQGKGSVLTHFERDYKVLRTYLKNMK